MKVWLIGMPGAGKSSVGRALARRLGVPFVDADAQVERETGRTVAEIFSASGEAEFRRLESAVIERLAAGPDNVVACGGGVVTGEANRRTMRGSGTVVFLDLPPEVLASRVRLDGSRPLLRTPTDVVTLHGEREALYRETAHLRIDYEGRPAEVARRIEEALG